MKTRERVISARLILKSGRHMEYAGRLGISMETRHKTDDKHGGISKYEKN